VERGLADQGKKHLSTQGGTCPSGGQKTIVVKDSFKNAKGGKEPTPKKNIADLKGLKKESPHDLESARGIRHAALRERECRTRAKGEDSQNCKSFHALARAGLSDALPQRRAL